MAAKRARFEQLAMPAVNALYRQAMRLTNDPDDAQDLVQDTFERGFKAFDSFQPGSNFEAWMTTIERNAYFNQYAKAKRRPQRANDSTGEYDDWDIYDAAEHTSDGLKSAEEEYLDAFAPEEIMAALAKLSPERRQVFIDAAIDGKSYQQVADEQGVKIGTVMSRLNRARTQLKRELASYAKERGYVTGSSAGSPSAKLGENVGRIADWRPHATTVKQAFGKGDLMNDQPVERTRHISITRTGADGMVSQTEVHITAVHHRSVDTGSASASVQADVHIVTEGDCFDPRTCCDEREQALIAALRAYLRPDVAPECLMARLKATLDHCCGEDK